MWLLQTVWRKSHLVTCVGLLSSHEKMVVVDTWMEILGWNAGSKFVNTQSSSIVLWHLPKCPASYSMQCVEVVLPTGSRIEIWYRNIIIFSIKHRVCGHQQVYHCRGWDLDRPKRRVSCTIVFFAKFCKILQTTAPLLQVIWRIWHQWGCAS